MIQRLPAFVLGAGLFSFLLTSGQSFPILFQASTARSLQWNRNNKPNQKQVKTMDLGGGKLIDLFVPPEGRNRQSSSVGNVGSTVSTFDGRGDVVWPAGSALASFVAHFPEIIHDRRVMDLGCGLGLVAAAGLRHGKPAHVALCDRDPSALSLAYATCSQLYRTRSSVSRCKMDWEDARTWPNQAYDVLLGSDILYDKASIVPIVHVLKHYLSSQGDDTQMPKQALFSDPIAQVNRDAFNYAAHDAGLQVEELELPEMQGFAMLRVTCNSAPSTT